MNIVVFGASGMIGHRVWLELEKNWPGSVYGVFRKSVSQFQSYNIFNKNIIDQTDLTNWGNVEKILENLRPKVIINAAGLTIRKQEVSDLSYAMEINSFFPHRLLKWAQSNQSKVIHFSTDCVFSGEKGSYVEESNPTAKDNYGRTKFLGEIVDQHALTLRFSCIGRELDAHTELLDWFLMQRGKKIKGYNRAIYSGITTLEVANQVIRVIKNHPTLTGLYQISSPPISKYELLCLINEKYGTKTEISPFEDYVANKSLNCEKFKSVTGFVSKGWNEMIDDLVNDTNVKYKNF